MMWNLKRLEYMEDPKYPATIIFHGEFDMDEPDTVEFYPELCIRSSGVGVILEKVYSSEYSVPIGIEAGVLMSIEFFARQNMVPLLLDGAWKLDDSRKLSGYRSDIKPDFYPVEIETLSKVEVDAEIQSNVYVERLLDGSWKLDGSRKLNGGLFTL